MPLIEQVEGHCVLRELATPATCQMPHDHYSRHPGQQVRRHVRYAGAQRGLARGSTGVSWRAPSRQGHVNDVVAYAKKDDRARLRKA